MADMQRLTQRQHEIYQFIVRQVRNKGLPPSLVEIARAFDLRSVAGISDHLKAIERKGFIRRRAGISRGIQLTIVKQGASTGRTKTRARGEHGATRAERLAERGASAQGNLQSPRVRLIPVLGDVPSQDRLRSVGDPTDSLQLDERLAPRGSIVVRVVSNRAEQLPHGVGSGDLLVVDPSAALRRDDLVVAQARGGAGSHLLRTTRVGSGASAGTLELVSGRESATGYDLLGPVVAQIRIGRATTTVQRASARAGATR